MWQLVAEIFLIRARSNRRIGANFMKFPLVSVRVRAMHAAPEIGDDPRGDPANAFHEAPQEHGDLISGSFWNRRGPALRHIMKPKGTALSSNRHGVSPIASMTYGR